MNTYFKRMIESNNTMVYQVYEIHLLNGTIIEAAEDYELPTTKGLVGKFNRMEEGDILTVEDWFTGSFYIPRRSILYISTGDVREGDSSMNDLIMKGSRKK